MIYNLSEEIQRQQAHARLEWLVLKQKRIEIKEIRGKRTTPQNAYLHLLLSFFALEVGETLDFIKLEVFKKKVNPDVFRTERKNPKI